MSGRLDNLARRIAARGYGWYLALKIAKAAWCPFAAVLVPVWIALYAALAIGIAAWETFAECMSLARAVVATFARRKWFSGFSRKHYESLEQYKMPGESQG